MGTTVKSRGAELGAASKVVLSTTSDQALSLLPGNENIYLLKSFLLTKNTKTH
jgi:hypothetical protein